jgi:hypothetical protein
LDSSSIRNPDCAARFDWMIIPTSPMRATGHRLGRCVHPRRAFAVGVPKVRSLKMDCFFTFPRPTLIESLRGADSGQNVPVIVLPPGSQQERRRGAIARVRQRSPQGSGRLSGAALGALTGRLPREVVQTLAPRTRLLPGGRYSMGPPTNVRLGPGVFARPVPIEGVRGPGRDGTVRDERDHPMGAHHPIVGGRGDGLQGGGSPVKTWSPSSTPSRPPGRRRPRTDRPPPFPSAHPHRWLFPLPSRHARPAT